MPPNGAHLHTLGARFEDGVKLSAILEHFPGALESGGYHEAITGAELPALTRVIFQCNSTACETAELRFAVADAPFTARARPHAGVELLR